MRNGGGLNHGSTPIYNFKADNEAIRADISFGVLSGRNFRRDFSGSFTNRALSEPPSQVLFPMRICIVSTLYYKNIILSTILFDLCTRGFRKYKLRPKLRL